jgi:hypothetical protein
MRHYITPEDLPQNLLFDDFETHWIHTQLDPSALRTLNEGWQGVFRRTALKCLPAPEIAQHFSAAFGRPTKEIYSMIGLLLIMEFKQWTADEAAEAYSFDAGVQFALNLARDHQYVCPRTVENYKRLLREGDEHCADIFGTVTSALVLELQIDITRQRLDSTHVFSYMARLTRGNLMAVTVKRFLTQVLRHDPTAHAALPDELRQRYAPAEGRIFGYGKSKADSQELVRRIQQTAEDLHFLIERFEGNPRLNGRSTWQGLVRVFQDHCELKPAKGRRGKPVITIKEKATDSSGQSSRVLQNPSDPEAGYDGHKGPGYQLQLAQSYGEDNEVNLITACLPQSAAESDSASLIPVIENQADYGLQPEKVLADTAYGGDENVEACREGGVELISPVAGKAPAKKPAGRPAAGPDNSTADEAPDEPKGRKERLEQRRGQQQTEAWKKEYAKRSGQEGVNRALDRVTGIKQLVVRGKGAVRMALYLKTVGWNLLKAGQAYAQRGIAARKMELQAA